MMEEEENCTLIEVTEDEVENSIQHINNLDSLILVKVDLKITKKFFSFINFSATQENVFLKIVKKNYELWKKCSSQLNYKSCDDLFLIIYFEELFISKNHIYLI